MRVRTVLNSAATFVPLLGLAALAQACETPAERAMERRAERIEDRAEQLPRGSALREQLERRADDLERRADRIPNTLVPVSPRPVGLVPVPVPVPPDRITIVTARGGGPGGEAAVRELADARCDALDRCGQLGPGRQYANRAACMSDSQRVMQYRVNPGACGGGIDTAALSTCEQTVQASACGTTPEQFGQLAQCAPARLCR